MRTARRLAEQLGTDRRILRKTYRTVVEGERRGAEEWLRDNYYLLERAAASAQRDLKKSPPLPSLGGRPVIYVLCEKAAYAERGKQTIEQVLYEILEESGGGFSSRELELCGLFLQTALLHLAAASLHSEDDAFGRAVEGIREVSSLDVEELIERFCPLENILSTDPAGVYPQMSKETRALYRRTCARRAQKEGISEIDFARRAIQLSQQESDPRRRHVGYFVLETDPKRVALRRRGRFMLWIRGLLPLAASVALAWALGAWWLIFLLYLPLFALLRPLLEWLSIKGVAPTMLPRMELDGRVPDTAPTLVTVSCLVPKPEGAGELCAHLESLWRGCGVGDIRFCLLADLKQSELPRRPEDAPAIEALAKGVERLNRKHGEHFYLFVRPRVMVSTQNAYAGWERKRGAIAQLIRYTRGERIDFLRVVGDSRFLPRVKYLIALDADTRLSMDAAAELVSITEHPLNRPVIDPDRRVVTAGYGIIAPRVETDIHSAGRTLFSRVMTGAGGVSAYDTLSGNFYADCFGRGIFAGKGLIDADAFLTCMEGALPRERVLSHDVIEGGFLRCAFASDVAATDGCPSAADAWNMRQHRWIRGDVQNILWLFGRIPDEGGTRRNPFDALTRFFLLDNLVRALTDIAIPLLLLPALFLPHAAWALVLTGILSSAASGLFSAVSSLVRGGLSMLSRRYYSHLLPDASSALARAGMSVVLSVQSGAVALDALIRGLWRQLVSRRNLLEWVTAAEADRRHKGSFLHALSRCWQSVVVGGALAVFFGGALRLFGLITLTSPLVLWLTARVIRTGEIRLSEKERDEIRSYAAAMWRYYDRYCRASDHYLPPDNVQESPVHAVAHRTSPTNIGLAMLCTLCARDLGEIDSEGMCERLSHTLDSVERLETWQGNLLNWYDTKTLRTLHPRFCSAVDSGNFVCCLVALREGLMEYTAECPALTKVCERLQVIIERTDLAAMYDPKKRLFHIGFDLEGGKLSSSYYDLLMSEARLMSYFAVARRQVPKKHWGALGRTLAGEGRYAGAVSWTGTMFEYYMPHLLLPAWEGSLLYESLGFCLYCQRKKAAERGLPWGCSESAYYAFDPQFQYQYKAHGIQRLGLKRMPTKEYVISPYSTFLTLPMNPGVSLRNLRRLKKLGATGECGFYEAIDFTSKRCGSAPYAVVRSYMAHHVGMSLCALLNALSDNLLQKRFLRGEMAAAEELLKESVPSGAAVFEDVVRRDAPEKPGRITNQTEEYDDIHPRTPRMHLLSGGGYTLLVSDNGSSVSVCQGVDITRRSTDMLRRPQGVFAVVEGAGECFCLSRAPDYRESAAHRVEFAPSYAAFYARKGTLEGGVSASVHPSIPCERRTVQVRNHSQKRVEARVLLYFEPCLASAAAAAAHPAFSALFLEKHYDPSLRLLTFTRRTREGESPVSIAVGFADGREFNFDCSRERVLSRPKGIEGLPTAIGRELEGEGGLPDLCAAIRIKMEIAPRSQRSATLLISAAVSPEQAINQLLRCRHDRLEPSQGALSPLYDKGLESRLATALLPELVGPARDAKERLAAARENRLGLGVLWSMGLSGDMPIVVVELRGIGDLHMVDTYLGVLLRLRRYSMLFDLVFLYREGGEYGQPIRGGVEERVNQRGAEELCGRPGGVHLVDSARVGEAEVTCLLAAAAYIAPRTVSRIAPPLPDYLPMSISEVTPPQDTLKGYAVEGGVFGEGCFTVTGQPNLPWCHILSNGNFGTMLSDRALGFTFGANARENKLTPWYNDSRSDNRGEMLLLRLDGKTYDVCNGARVTYWPGRAVYEGQAGTVSLRLEVGLPDDGCAKRLKLELIQQGEEEKKVEIAYYTEPVLGVDRRGAARLWSRWEEGKLFVTNPFQSNFPGAMMLACDAPSARCCCDRSAFLCGRWDEHTLLPLPDPCGSVIVARKLPPRRREKVQFVLAFGPTEEAARADGETALTKDWSSMQNQNSIRISTDDPALDHMVNTWLPLQFQNARLKARTGFYQCSGAWGFRDQLQDSCAELLLNPQHTREHLLRCASRQFEEGDVLHWWHELPTGPAGVRTRCSDDLLWLPYAVCEYVEATGDTGVLEEQIPFLSAPELSSEEDERYFTPAVSEKTASLMEHCLRAIRRVSSGEHALPLMGSCDWNDGLSNVGRLGRGESVWLAQFLSIVEERMAALCLRRGETDEARQLLDSAKQRKEAVDREAFDGEWYLRAYTDSGQPMGSHHSGEGQLDLLPQAFAALSNMPDHERIRRALDACLDRLIDRERGIVKLFDPPFDQFDAGYIRAYPKGLRENGGQYTHAAVWLMMALFHTGRCEEGYALLRILNPAVRCADPEKAKRYAIEPYSMPADIYTHPTLEGRGGWSHYTGSAGWFYRAVLGSFLGIRLHGDRMSVSPCLPKKMTGYSAELRVQGTLIHLQVSRGEKPGLTVDGQAAHEIPLDHGEHTALLMLHEN